MAACSHNHIHCAELLLKNSNQDTRGDAQAQAQARAQVADVDQVNDFKVTALIKAAAVGHTHIVSLLLRSHAQVDLASQYGVTALIASARAGHTAVVQLLLDAQADVRITNVYKDTALSAAQKAGHGEVTALLDPASAGVQAASEGAQNSEIQAERTTKKGMKKMKKKRDSVKGK
jgi:ankyrin repeat protein